MRKKSQRRRTWAAAGETGREDLLAGEGRSWFETMVESVVVVAAGRRLGPGNNSEGESEGFGATEELDVVKTATQAALGTERCLRSLSGRLGQKDLQGQRLNTTEAADWTTKESHLETKPVQWKLVR